MFRFEYPRPFLRWALLPPGWLPQWHCGVRAVGKDGGKGKLLAFITAIPADIRVYKETMKMVEINFLCVHKKLRAKRLAPVLIQEITRRVNLTGIFQATYTAGVRLPKPISVARYWHRSLQVRKLIEVGFSHMPRGSNFRRQELFNRVPDKPLTPGFRQMKESDVGQVTRLLNAHLQKYDLAPSFTDDEVKHWLLPRAGVIDTYVVYNNGNVTDFTSFYTLPSTIIRHPKYNLLNAAYNYYTVAKTVPLKVLLNDALAAAKNSGHDVYNALDILENDTEMLKELRFGIGDGNLHYYLFNYLAPETTPSKVGLVLL